MDTLNPRFVLRNYLAQEAIDAIEQHDDTSLLLELLDVLRHPYDEQPGKDRFSAKRPGLGQDKGRLQPTQLQLVARNSQLVCETGRSADCRLTPPSANRSRPTRQK